MNAEDLALIHQVAEQKMNGLSQVTQRTYRRFLQQWGKAMRRKELIDYDANEVAKWNRRFGKNNRSAAFPIRCVEVVQAIAPERVSADFFVPQGLWSGDAFCYRQKVIPATVLADMVACAVKDMEATTTLTRESVIPFVVLMAIRTGMNVESLLTLRQDCCSQGETRYLLRWVKGRSGGELTGEYFPMPWGPREIVARVRELAGEHELLWVVADSKQRPFRDNGVNLRQWLARHQIRYFPLQEIRPAMATKLYEDTGDIQKVKVYLHHESIATTILYLAEYAVLPKAEEDIAKALDNIARKAGLL